LVASLMRGVSRHRMRLAPFVAVTAFHVVLCAIAGLFGTSIAVAVFDAKGPAVAASVVALMGWVLFFPIQLLSAVVDVGTLSGAAEAALFLSNSLVWGALGATIWSWCRRRT
jgi:hypothetical protein